VTDRQAEARPAGVPETTTQVGEIQARWGWVEPSVWTERMLTALEKGVKGGKWFSLIDKVYALPNLRAAFQKVKAKRGAAGVDHQTIEMFERRLEENLENLSCMLREGRYRPQAVRRVMIPKPGSKEKLQRRPRSPGDRSWQVLINPSYVAFGPHGHICPDARSITQPIISKTALAGKVILHTSP